MARKKQHETTIGPVWEMARKKTAKKRFSFWDGGKKQWLEKTDEWETIYTYVERENDERYRLYLLSVQLNWSPANEEKNR